MRAREDADGQFILLWIVFNAAYATEIDERFRLSEQETFQGFLEKLTQLDAGQRRFEALVHLMVNSMLDIREAIGPRVEGEVPRLRQLSAEITALIEREYR